MARTTEANNGFSKLTKLLATLITVIVVSVGAVIWITNAFADQKDWTVQQDRVIKEDMKEQYVQKHEFTPVQQQLEDIKKSLDSLNKKLDRALRRRDHPRGDGSQ